jgi:hypothetical protein
MASPCYPNVSYVSWGRGQMAFTVTGGRAASRFVRAPPAGRVLRNIEAGDNTERSRQLAARSFLDPQHRAPVQRLPRADRGGLNGFVDTSQAHPSRHAVATGLRDAASRLRVAGSAYLYSLPPRHPATPPLHRHGSSRRGGDDQGPVGTPPVSRVADTRLSRSAGNGDYGSARSHHRTGAQPRR